MSSARSQRDGGSRSSLRHPGLAQAVDKTFTYGNPSGTLTLSRSLLVKNRRTEATRRARANSRNRELGSLQVPPEPLTSLRGCARDAPKRPPERNATLAVGMDLDQAQEQVGDRIFRSEGQRFGHS